MNSSKGLVTSVPLAGTAEEEEDEEKDDEDEEPIGSRPSNTILLTTMIVPCEVDVVGVVGVVDVVGIFVPPPVGVTPPVPVLPACVPPAHAPVFVWNDPGGHFPLLP